MIEVGLFSARENSESVNPCAMAPAVDITSSTPLPEGRDPAGAKGSDLDSVAHPDLVALGRAMRARMDQTLDAEMEAARASARRRRSLRDRLLEAEDSGMIVVVGTADGSAHRGFVEAVGVDHVELAHADVRLTIALAHICVIEASP